MTPQFQFHEGCGAEQRREPSRDPVKGYGEGLRRELGRAQGTLGAV